MKTDTTESQLLDLSRKGELLLVKVLPESDGSYNHKRISDIDKTLREVRKKIKFAYLVYPANYDIRLADEKFMAKMGWAKVNKLKGVRKVKNPPNDPSSPTPPTAGADCQQEADGGVGCSAWLGGNDKQENTSILNLLSLCSSQSERKSLMSSLAQSSRPALSEPDKKSHTWLKRLRGMLLSVLRFGRTSQQTKSLKP